MADQNMGSDWSGYIDGGNGFQKFLNNTKEIYEIADYVDIKCFAHGIFQYCNSTVSLIKNLLHFTFAKWNANNVIGILGQSWPFIKHKISDADAI